MSELILDSLEIKNFRAFKHLRIEKLGRVNLIVGKNNVGKSSVLEALWIYAEQAEPALLYRLLNRRDEIATDSKGVPNLYNPNERALALNNFFLDRENTGKSHAPIRIGSAFDRNSFIQVDVDWLASEDKKTYVYPRFPMLSLYYGERNSVSFALDQDYAWGNRFFPAEYSVIIKTVYVGTEGISSVDLAVFWDAIALSDLEQEVINALAIIAPEVTAVNLVGGDLRNRARIPMVRTEKNKKPIPLRSLGEGMNRMLGIALALVNAKDGMLLIDEVDTGLHYSVLPDMWKLIFEVAHRLNVQVFATSHSWDCIQAFQQAAADSKEAEGVLVRLEQRKDGIGAVTFDEDELAIVTREQIEVR